jgi:recombination protein RecA
MARPKKTTPGEDEQETSVEAKPTKVGVDISSFLKKMKGIKGMEMASTLDISKMSNISEWVSTGSYSLNKILSGDIYKGVPRGRIMALAGLSGVGKTYVCGNCAREAQLAGYTVVFCDSENAINKDFMGRIGVNVESIIHIPVVTVTGLRNTLMKFMDEFHKDYPKEKLYIIVDSIGGLTTEKVYADIEEDKSAQDMGLRAKQLRDMAKVFTNHVAKYQSVMLCTNHIYEKPAPNPNMQPTPTFGGGEGFVYATSGIVYLTKRQLKEDTQTSLGDTVKRKTGNIIKLKTEKNRFVPEGLQGEMHLDYIKGLNKWYGLLEDAVDFKYVSETSKGWYTFAHNGAKVRTKDLYKSENWVGFIDKLADDIRAKYKYADFVTTDLEELDTAEEPTPSSETA